MSSSDRSWSASFGGLADLGLSVYDELMVPRMFGPWGRLLIDAVALAPGESVLDVACGPGSVTRAAAVRVGPTGRVVGCDLSPRMLELAQAKPQPEGGAEITYGEAPAERLPGPDEQFDVVVCQQGIQFFPDRAAAVREMRRVLKPGGRVGVAVWTAIEELPPFFALANAVEQVAGAELAARYRGGPFGFTDGEALERLIAEAGFSDVAVTAPSLPVHFEAGAAQVVTTLATTPLAESIDRLSAEQRRELVDAVAAQTGEGPIESTLRANLAVAVR